MNLYVASPQDTKQQHGPLSGMIMPMKYSNLRDFIHQLIKRGLLQYISQEVDPYLEITAIFDHTLRTGRPALLFENVKGSDVPVLSNLFGTPEQVTMGMDEDSVEILR